MLGCSRTLRILISRRMSKLPGKVCSTCCCPLSWWHIDDRSLRGVHVWPYQHFLGQVSQVTHTLRFEYVHWLTNGQLNLTGEFPVTCPFMFASFQAQRYDWLMKAVQSGCKQNKQFVFSTMWCPSCNDGERKKIIITEEKKGRKSYTLVNIRWRRVYYRRVSDGAGWHQRSQQNRRSNCFCLENDSDVGEALKREQSRIESKFEMRRAQSAWLKCASQTCSNCFCCNKRNGAITKECGEWPSSGANVVISNGAWVSQHSRRDKRRHSQTERERERETHKEGKRIMCESDSKCSSAIKKNVQYENDRSSTPKLQPTSKMRR